VARLRGGGKSCLDKAYRLLARRPHSVHELTVKLKEAGYGAGEVDEVVRLLVEKGYLDDDAYCKGYAASRVDRMRLGPKRLRADLARKGFDEALVESALENVYGSDGGGEWDVAHEAARKKAAAFKPEMDAKEMKRKLFGHLVRRGFSTDVARGLALDMFDKLREG